MWIDLGVAVIVLLYTVMGLFQGVIVQLFRLAGLVLVLLYVMFVAEPVGHWLALHLEIGSPLAAYCISLIAGSLIVYAICALIGRGVHRLVTGGKGAPRQADRVLGALLGLAKGAIVAFLLLSIADMVPASSLGRRPWVQAQLRQSRIMPIVHPVNPLPKLRFLADIDDYKKILENPEAQRLIQDPGAFANRPDYRKLRLGYQAMMGLYEKHRDELRELADDPHLLQLIKENRWNEVFVHQKVLTLVFDPDVRRILNDENFRARLRAALEEAERLHPKKPSR